MTFFVNTEGDKRRRETQDRRAGQCRCGAQMRYTGGGAICTVSQKPKGKCENNASRQAVNDVMQSALTSNTRAG